MKTTKNVAILALVASLVLVSLPAEARHTETHHLYSGPATWTWYDGSSDYATQVTEPVFLHIDLWCKGQTDCQGGIFVDGAYGVAACYIERGQDSFSGGIVIGPHQQSCHDVPQASSDTVALFLCSGGATVTGNPANTYEFGGNGAGQGVC